MGSKGYEGRLCEDLVSSKARQIQVALLAAHPLGFQDSIVELKLLVVALVRCSLPLSSHLFEYCSI